MIDARASAVLVVGLTAAITGCGGDAASTVDATPSDWSFGPPLPARRLEAGVVAMGSRLVVVGGYDRSLAEGLRITAAVDVLDTEAGAWLAPLPPLPLALTHVDVAAIDDTLYVLGGLEGVELVASGAAWALDPGATTWRPLAPLPAGLERGAAGVVSAPGHIYLLGGASTDGALATCLDYDLAGDAWSELPALPGPRSHPAAMRGADGTLYVAGGLATNDSTAPLDDVLALPPGAPAWTSRAARLPQARGGCAYGVVDGALVCAGGEAGRSALRDVYLYDPAADAWTALEPMPASRAGVQGTTVGGRFYVAGGAAALQYRPLDTLLVYTPPP